MTIERDRDSGKTVGNGWTRVERAEMLTWKLPSRGARLRTRTPASGVIGDPPAKLNSLDIPRVRQNRRCLRHHHQRPCLSWVRPPVFLFQRRRGLALKSVPVKSFMLALSRRWITIRSLA